jgi:hypothetical protein
VLAVDREGSRQSFERTLWLVEMHFVDLGHLVQQLDLAVRIFLVLDQHFERLREPRGVTRRAVDRLEHTGRGHGLAIGRDHALQRSQGGRVIGHVIEDVAVGLDRAEGVVQLLLVQLSDAVAQIDRLQRIARQLRLALEDRQQIFGAAGGQEQRVQPRQRREIFGIEIQHALVGLDGLVRLTELPLVDRAHLGVE